MTELATSLTAEYDGVMWVAKRDGVQIGPRYTFAHQALQALTSSLAAEAEPVAWLCNGMGSGWIERDKITFDREAAEHMAAQEVWTVVPLYTHPSSSVSAEVTVDAKALQSAVCDALLNAFPMADKIADNYAAVAARAALASINGGRENG